MAAGKAPPIARKLSDLAIELGYVQPDVISSMLARPTGESLRRRLQAAGLLDADQQRRLYRALEEQLSRADPRYREKLRDAKLVKLALSARAIDRDQLARAQATRRQRYAEGKGREVAPLLCDLLETAGDLAAEQRAACERELATDFHACQICGHYTPFGGADDEQLDCLRCGAPAEADAESVELVAARTRDPLIGNLLGRCRLLRQLGRGGMGVVYLAHHTTLDTRVAVKVLPHWLAAQAGYQERFWREARIAARISHAHLVRVLDVSSQDGVHFIVMEYVQGRSLKDVVSSDGALPVSEAVRIIREAAGALGAAHRAGVIHRDVKPDNLMLTAEGLTKVADFGLARDLAGTNLSFSGQIIGTPGFMAPEQLRGEPSDERADIFALGLTLFTLIAGEPPFQAENAIAAMVAVESKPLPPLPEAPSALQRVVDQMTRKDPAERYAQMSDVEAALGEALEGASQAQTVPVAQGAPPSSATPPQRATDLVTHERPTLVAPVDGYRAAPPPPARVLPPPTAAPPLRDDDTTDLVLTAPPTTPRARRRRQQVLAFWVAMAGALALGLALLLPAWLAQPSPQALAPLVDSLLSAEHPALRLAITREYLELHPRTPHAARLRTWQSRFESQLERTLDRLESTVAQHIIHDELASAFARLDEAASALRDPQFSQQMERVEAARRAALPAARDWFERRADWLEANHGGEIQQAIELLGNLPTFGDGDLERDQAQRIERLAKLR